MENMQIYEKKDWKEIYLKNKQQWGVHKEYVYT